MRPSKIGPPGFTIEPCATAIRVENQGGSQAQRPASTATVRDADRVAENGNASCGEAPFALRLKMVRWPAGPVRNGGLPPKARQAKGGGEGGIRTPGATRAHVISSHAG